MVVILKWARPSPSPHRACYLAGQRDQWQAVTKQNKCSDTRAAVGTIRRGGPDHPGWGRVLRAFLGHWLLEVFGVGCNGNLPPIKEQPTWFSTWKNPLVLPGFRSWPWDWLMKVALLSLNLLSCKWKVRSVTSRFRPFDFAFIWS